MAQPLRFVTVVEIDGVEWWTRREVAAFCEVLPSSIPSLIKNSGMPEAEHRIERTPLWRPATIRAWHAARPGPGWRKGQGES